MKLLDKNRSYTLDDFDYVLPPECIAQVPLAERSASRLLVLGHSGELHDRHMSDLPEYLRPGDLLVLNDTRVIRARLHGHKASGGAVEVLIERLSGPHEALAQVRASKSPRPDSRLHMADGAFDFTVLGRAGEFYHLRSEDTTPLDSLLERYGTLPLPPYITRPADATDDARYQTVFGCHPGSVAAPTAGLHFDPPLFERLRARGVQLAWVTLHVGAGTFQPVRVHRLDEHVMHRERYVLPQATLDAISATHAAGGRVIAVGTTSLRALEGAARQGALQAGSGETDLFILPGYRFQVVDALLTNFHLPRSTLLMLVSALAGMAPVRAAYRHAIAAGYRFFSYGDAMFIPGRNDHAL